MSTHELPLQQWVTLTFDLAFRSAFRWAKVRSKSDLSQKVKWFRRAKDLGQIYGLSTDLDRPKLSWTLV